MSPEDGLQSAPLGFSAVTEDFTLSRGDLDNSREPGGRARARSSLHTTPESGISCHGDFASKKNTFLKILMDAEAAANSAAIQLVSFKDAMDDEYAVSKHSTKDKRQIARQRGLLLEKLEEFRRINKSVRQKLKQLQEAEANRIGTDQQIDTLLNKITQAESENKLLKKDLSESEQKVRELMDLRRAEQENIKSAVHVTKSVEATRAHLQGQLRNKEAENNRLAVQLRALERTIIEQKMEIDDLKGSITSLSVKAAQDKESLKKATRAQKLRAERFEAAIEKCYAQLREKDAQLAKAHSERDLRRQRKEQMTDEKDKLVADIDLLKSQIADLTVRLQKEKDELTAANETLMQKLEKLNTDNGELSINNAALKESVTQLEQQLADCESALVEEKIVSQEKKHQAEQCHCQVAQLQAELHDLKMKYRNLLRDTEKTREGKDTEVEKVRQELQRRVEELEAYPELLSAAEQSLFECQENLRRSERKCSEKSESIRQLQVKMESQSKLLSSSAEMKESIHESNLQLQEKVISLQKEMDKLQQENLELVRRLAAQEEALSYSNRQLDQRSSECQALSRQLEAALADVRQQVSKVKEQAISREEALQTKILELGAEKSRRDNELRLLRQSKLTAEKQYEVRLKDLQLSLDQSESHKRSIQNYVDFLKNSYKAMFDEGLQTSTFGSSYFPK
ncbi:outer dense fiber protein 2 isoform X1 [Archocentrus centrarchus]|uniref:outer dense fiber protein 2 isoform X1 n=1 Tax=Archocentrus centrarchus TaxID=63155 RepID=UPI0011E9BC23|nr:protein BCAP isoform X1 [Archocentrus centrarchus]XP_030608268.1 protein BCAP isoform X1 [Archocentrus centrarchus]XP_030608269.1 protein BCAP isoform X1 [Archocentrus centrarchus]